MLAWSNVLAGLVVVAVTSAGGLAVAGLVLLKPARELPLRLPPARLLGRQAPGHPLGGPHLQECRRRGSRRARRHLVDAGSPRAGTPSDWHHAAGLSRSTPSIGATRAARSTTWWRGGTGGSRWRDRPAMTWWPSRCVASTSPPSFFDMLGVQAALGRTFRPEEEEPGRDRVVVLSAGFWKRRFGADPTVVGKTVLIDGEPFAIIGVLPRDFYFLWPDSAVFSQRLLRSGNTEVRKNVPGANVIIPSVRHVPSPAVPGVRVHASVVVDSQVRSWGSQSRRSTFSETRGARKPPWGSGPDAFVSWNRIALCLRQIEGLRGAS